MSCKKQKHVHFIGIGGSGIASLAIACVKNGFKVTGSEAGPTYEPIKSLLKKNKIDYYYPFDGTRVGQPDEIVVGNAHYSDNNPEVVYARENNIELEHFPRLIEKYLIKEKSIVVAGTYGKTSMTTMVAHIFKEAGKNPSYMIGGAPIGFESGANLTKTKWSVVEGDEYPAASPWDFSPKFDYYHPKYLLLTSAEWDHFDIYKTKKSYIDAFKKMVRTIPEDGLVVSKLEGENIFEILDEAKCRVVFYSTGNKKVKVPTRYQNKKIYFISSKKNMKNGFKFSISCGQEVQILETKVLGDFNIENWCGAVAMTRELGVKQLDIQKAVSAFQGIRRRMEMRYKKNGVIVIDDFAHNFSKAREAIKSAKSHFPDSRIFAIFEPNRGGRSIKCIKKYDHVFDGVHRVFIPQLHEYKQKPGVRDVTGKELVAQIKKTNQQAFFVPVWSQMKQKILKSVKPGDVVLFMGHGNFNDPINDLRRSL